MWHGAWAPRVADTYNHSVHVTRAGHQQQYHIPKATEEVAFLPRPRCLRYPSSQTLLIGKGLCPGGNSHGLSIATHVRHFDIRNLTE